MRQKNYNLHRAPNISWTTLIMDHCLKLSEILTIIDNTLKIIINNLQVLMTETITYYRHFNISYFVSFYTKEDRSTKLSFYFSLF
jgi:predicted Zn-dependent protease